MTEPASFLGIACEGIWEVVIVEQALWPAATHGVRSGSVRFGQIHDVLTELRQKSEIEDRCVVAWSTRELEEIQSVLIDFNSPMKDIPSLQVPHCKNEVWAPYNPILTQGCEVSLAQHPAQVISYKSTLIRSDAPTIWNRKSSQRRL